MPVTARPPKSRLSLAVGHPFWTIALVAVFVGATAGALSQRQATYTAEATLQVNVLATKGVGQAAALAGNELAIQYSQLVKSDVVLEKSAQKLGVTSAQLRGHVEGSPLDAVNIIRIDATESRSNEAAKVASTVASTLVAQIISLNQSRVAAALDQGSARRATLDAQITDIQARNAADEAALGALGTLGDRAATSLAAGRSLLASLISTRELVYTASASDLMASLPTLTTLVLPTAGSRNGQPNVVYLALAALVGLFIAVEVLVLRERTRLEQPLFDPGTSPDLRNDSGGTRSQDRNGPAPQDVPTG